MSAVRAVDEVRFEISDEAAALIRGRGSELWIWPSADRRPYASCWPPAPPEIASWTTYAPEGLTVHVDSAVEPPKRWVLTGDATRVVARWNGLESAIFGRLPVAGAHEEPAEPEGSPLAHVRKFLVIPVLAWVFAVLWALRFVGVSGAWIWTARSVVMTLVFVIGLLARGRDKLAERREDKAFDAKFEHRRG